MDAVRLKSSFIYLANAVRDLTENWRVIGLVLVPLALSAALCLLPDALNLQHLLVQKFEPGFETVAWLPVQTPYLLPTGDPLVAPWATRLLHVVFLIITAAANLVVLSLLKWIREHKRARTALQATGQIYRRAAACVLPFAWVFLLQMVALLPLFLWTALLLPLVLAVLVVLFIVPGFLIFVWLCVAQYAVVLDGHRSWVALFYGRELVRGRLLRVTLRIVVFLALWSGYNTWGGGVFLALSLLLGLLGAITGALWFGVFLADLLAVSVAFITTAFFFAAGARLYQDLSESAPKSAQAIAGTNLTPTGPLHSAL